MKIRKKNTGEIVEVTPESVGRVLLTYGTLKDFTDDWEDAPKMHHDVLPKPIRRMVQAWVDAQENPIEEISILDLCSGPDQDGYVNYKFYGYVSTSGNKNLTAIDVQVRVKKAFKFIEHYDYKLEELGLKAKKRG